MRCRSRRRPCCGRRSGRHRRCRPGAGGDDGSDAGQLRQGRPRCEDHLLQLAGERRDLLLDDDQLGDLLGGEPASGLAGHVTRFDRRQDRLGLAGGDVPGSTVPEPVPTTAGAPGSHTGSWPGSARPDGRPATAAPRAHVVGQHPKSRGAPRNYRDCVRVVRVGLAVVTSVQRPRPRGKLGWDIDDVLPVGQQPPRQRTPGAVAELHRPHPVRVAGHVLSHRRVAGLVGAEPVGRQDRLAFVDDLDRRRQLWGSTPMKLSP